MDSNIILIIGSERSVFINLDMTSNFSINVEGTDLYIVISDVQEPKQYLHKAVSKEVAYRLQEELVQGIVYGIQKDGFARIDLRRLSRNCD